VHLQSAPQLQVVHEQFSPQVQFSHLQLGFEQLFDILFSLSLLFLLLWPEVGEASRVFRRNEVGREGHEFVSEPQSASRKCLGFEPLILWKLKLVVLNLVAEQLLIQQ